MIEGVAEMKMKSWLQNLKDKAEKTTAKQETHQAESKEKPKANPVQVRKVTQRKNPEA
jgi:hypothetical protein